MKKSQREESKNLQTQFQQQQDSSNVEKNLMGRRKSQGGQLWLWKISHTSKPYAITVWVKIIGPN
jgi:hypothetical protein